MRLATESKAKIHGINGPVITVKGNNDLKMLEMVFVGQERLIGEVISIKNDETTIQVYEVTTGLKLGEPVISTGKPLSLRLGPGIIGNIFDGIQRPLVDIEKQSGIFLKRGMSVNSLSEDIEWETKITIKNGDNVFPGMVIAEIKETPSVVHKVMVPPGIEGEVIETSGDGKYNISKVLVKVKTRKGVEELTMVQEWPVRQPRPFKQRIRTAIPLITGQRVIDTLFPIIKGGAAAIPGGFGTGKTLTQHQLAKWSDADIIVYIGCGERGNEITEVLEEFPKLIDPRTKEALMNRTVLIANTSNMPVAAREASIYTGITLAEYYRDMGYDVAIMADSTSRWAEALREISGRLEEMPAEEGYPAYLPSRLSEFYERAGMVQNLNDSEGSVSIIGAVSPQGADFSEPVTQNTKRFIRCFWALDKQLAYSRHYPAINWNNSYSEYISALSNWYKENTKEDFLEKRKKIMGLLQEESKLMEIVKLIGADILPDEQKLILEIAKVVRLGFLQQNAFHENDTYVPLIKQYYMMDTILKLYDGTTSLISSGIPISVLRDKGIFEEVTKMKYDIGNDENEKFEELNKKIESKLTDISKDYSNMERKKTYDG